jgi:predicted nucleic acid-binding protein
VYTLDTNIFVRDLDTRDPEHATCHALLQAVYTQHVPLICPLILLPEVAGAVRRTWNDPIRGRLAAQFVSELPMMVFIPIDALLAQEAAEIAADYALRGMDALYVAVARRNNCTLVTLDEEPRQRAGALVPVLTAAEALLRLTPPAADR